MEAQESTPPTPRASGLDVLLVEDDAPTAAHVLGLLHRAGHRATHLGDCESAVALFEERRFDVVLSDVRLPGADGHWLFAAVRERSPATAVILMSAFASVSEAVRAMKARATHYMAKPVDEAELLSVLDAVAEERRARPEDDVEPRLVGKTPALLRLKQSLPVIARSDASVLICGESGTGKELVARIIHERSGRAAGPFVAVSCASLRDDSLERELFQGDQGGPAREGRYRTAHGGTLFLDEVDEMSLSAQARLLRALEDRGRGAAEPGHEASDVRIIAATSADLTKRIESGRFRADLFYKLKVFQLRIPPLRERVADLPLLVQTFWERVSSQTGERFPASPRVWAALDHYDYPGNIRELIHAVEHAAVLARGGPIDLEHLPEELRGEGSTPRDGAPPSLPDAVREFEREYLLRTLAKAGGQRQRAAEMLGISRKTLWVKLKQYGVGGADEDE